MSPFLQKTFGFDPARHNVRTEILAGITTFLTMAYILAVNPNIFSSLEGQGMPVGAVFTATALAAIVGTLAMALYAKKPFGLGPGMGLNAFFVYTVCLGMGHSWQMALTAVFIEGIIFILLTATNVRKLIVDAIPMSLKRAIGVGIGFYIAFIGLKTAGIIVSNDSTFVSLGDVTGKTAILSIIGLLITSLLVIFLVRGGLLIGILVTTIIGIPFGETHYNGLISTPPSIEPIFMQFQWTEIFSWDMLAIVFTFLFIDMFDTIGTAVGLSVKAGMVDEKGNVDGINNVLMADAIATVAGAIFGTSTTSTYIESAAGVSEGGRTGLTAFTISVCFTIALLFSPLFLAIPGAATGPVLFIVGVMMAGPVKNIDWDDFSEAIPAFTTIIIMPLAYSISDGIMIGMITYAVLNGLSGRYKKVSVMTWILAAAFVLRYLLI